MNKTKKGFRGSPLAIVMMCVLALGACETQTAVQKQAEMAKIVEQDYAEIYTAPLQNDLTVEQAVLRALQYNLDAKIAQDDLRVRLSEADLQELSALPTMTAKADFITRSNKGASSSQSTITGVQSLEPSISQEQSNVVSLLEMNWNVLDTALSIYRHKSAVDRAIIAQERAKKVRQNIVMDTYNAYWRTAIGQKIKPEIQEVLSGVDRQLAGLADARKMGDMSLSDLHAQEIRLLEKRSSLLSAYESFRLAEIELKTLMSYPLGQPITLLLSEEDFSLDRIIDLAGASEDYIFEALQNRPEIAEELLNTKIAKREVKLQIYETIPGLNFLVGANRDENKFLEDAQWLSLTASLTQNVNNILTFSRRYEKAKKDQKLAETKRKALVAAVAAQVRIAQAIHENERRNFEVADRLSRNYTVEADRLAVRKEVGLSGGTEYLNMRIDSVMAKLQKYRAGAELHASVARFANSMGYGYEEYVGLGFFGGADFGVNQSHGVENEKQFKKQGEVSNGRV